jgi:dipeptidyl-peptidase-3
MKKILFAAFAAAAVLLSACEKKPAPAAEAPKDQFADLRILTYKVPGFEQLTAKEKELAYYLSQAALFGRDIIWDQNCQHNLTVRKTLEAIFNSYKGAKSGDEWGKFEVYAKRVFFSNGIHHHYSNNKLLPECSAAYFAELVKGSDAAQLPLAGGETVDAFVARLTPICFDPNVAPKRVNLDGSKDMLATSATNFYAGVTQAETDAYYLALNKKGGPNAPMYGLNSQFAKIDGKLVERIWKVGGMYTQAIEKMVYWLEKAIGVAENEQQKKTLEALVKYYQTGDLADFDAYNIEWVKDTASRFDLVHGFIEVYGDPLGLRGSFESVVSFKDLDASRRIKAIGDMAQWFEDNSTLQPAHKKPNVKGITAKVITVVTEAGDAAPSTPIGINLPNSNWIREQHGSKSVNLGNIVRAYNESASGSGMLEEFFFDAAMIARAEKWGALADDLHTDMHEVIGHASGRLEPGVKDPSITLKNYSNTLEEARADLVALYFLPDPKLREILGAVGIAVDEEMGRAAYDDYITNGLMIQLTRIPEEEKQLEEAHMRNRQLVAAWAYEKGRADNVVEKKTRDGKTFFVVNDYAKLRTLFGQLLAEIQRIKSQGDFAAGKALVEGYGVQIDHALHKEVLERYKKLALAPYKGFIQPRLVPKMEGDRVVDVQIEYPQNFLEQMLYFGKEYATLPVNN